MKKSKYRAITCCRIYDLVPAAYVLLKICKKDRFFVFYGKQGVGKTTFIKLICKELGVDDITASPSFSIVNEYQTSGKTPKTIYHFDFYRIKDISEVYDMGYEDYFYSNSYCFIEWPEKIETLLPPNYVKVLIEQSNAEKNIQEREITILSASGGRPPARWSNL